MHIGGVVKKAELMNLGNWNGNVLLITLEAEGTELILPVDPVAIQVIELEKFVEFDVAVTFESGQVTPVEKDTPLATAVNDELVDRVIGEKEIENDFDDFKSFSAAPIIPASDELLEDIPDEEIIALYDTDTKIEAITTVPKVDTMIAEILPEEFNDIEEVVLAPAIEPEEYQQPLEETRAFEPEDFPVEQPENEPLSDVASQFNDFMSNGLMPELGEEEFDHFEENG